ncbi:MAG: response regulator [Leptolyngbyaceae cyanobacterium SM2_5_2]|nr:response regulator [Leptolyngbyaceae cyanobacterium SM2_5_2]
MRSVIVCVDDEYSILKSLGSQLKRSFGRDYDVELASGGEDALVLCAELTAEGRGIPLIISDQRMQGMDGDTLLIQLHSLYPKTLKIMLTGQADADSIGNVVNAAALYRYIRKPWDETDLILTITEALRRFQQERELSQHNQLLKTINARLESSLSILLATLEATVDGILVLDHKGKIIIYNQNFINLWQLVDSGHASHRANILPTILQQLNEPDASQFKALFAQVNTEYHDILQLKDGRVFEYYLVVLKM